MTAVVCWERRVGPLSELVLASDSRLSGGETWDACPKLFNIGRSDVVLAFAGETRRAYPFVLQAIASVGAYGGSLRQSLDINQLVGHFRAVLNEMIDQVRDQADPEDPDCEFILAGWSWRCLSFRAYRVMFEPTKRAFISTAASAAPNSIGGDHASPIYLTIGDGGREITRRLAQARKSTRQALDLEPLDVLESICADQRFRTVGGSLQVSKAYRSLRTESFIVAGANKTPSISGRPLLKGENHDLRTLSKDECDTWQILSK